MGSSTKRKEEITMNQFDIKKIAELKARSEEQDEVLFKLRKRLALVERAILGFSKETNGNGGGEVIQKF